MDFFNREQVVGSFHQTMANGVKQVALAILQEQRGLNETELTLEDREQIDRHARESTRLFCHQLYLISKRHGKERVS